MRPTVIGRLYRAPARPGLAPAPNRGFQPRGQSLVEFALVLPMLLVLLLGIADFGRVFSAGITVEAAARNGAEADAQEYVQMARNRPGGMLTTDDYDHLHDVAIEKVCQESALLPNAVSSGGTCTMPAPMANCSVGPCTMPAVAVCVHDGSGDPGTCGEETAGVPAECTGLNGWDPLREGATPLGSPALPYVEVRVCYRFTTLVNLTNLNLPFGWSLSLGEIYLQKDRNFTVACYTSDTSACQ
jgi:hypothetical protein